jgi:2-C-methyl-D-erythritol 2,4-cyclodiphosphate synthase
VSVRIGHGFDAHRFGDGSVVHIGGVAIAHSRGIVAHSDGDVLLHALCDALLGAAALGDIGKHFPDSDPAFRGADSRRFVREVRAAVAQRGFRVGNVDATVVAEAPRLARYIDAMRTTIAADLAIELDVVNVKATTTEGMGYIGRGEGIAAHAVVTICD